MVHSDDTLRGALRVFPTGVTIVTTRGSAGDYGMTVNSFTSVSLTPPLILFCADARGCGPEILAANGVFAVNMLAADQEWLSRRFARRDRPGGARAFAGVEHCFAATGCPILVGTCAHLDCRLVGSQPSGDHVILIGEVVGLDYKPKAAPLLFHGGRYHTTGVGRAALPNSPTRRTSSRPAIQLPSVKAAGVA